MKVFVILLAFLVFPLTVAAESSAPDPPPKALVVSSSQDRDIAKLVAESKGYDYYETRWGKFTSEDVRLVVSKNPDVLLIIGGTYAVPERAEKIGIKSIRLGGFDRIETAELALQKFFDFDTKNSYVLPSSAEVSKFLNNAQETSAYLYLGDSDVSKRWGLYYREKLAPFFKEICLENSCNGQDSPVFIGVGNTKNNAFIDSNWHITGLPKEVSTFPLIFLSTANQSAILFITGTDQNIFFTQRSMEGLDIVKHDPRGLLVFWIFAVMIMALIGFFLSRRVIEPGYFVFLLFSFPVLVYFYIKTIPGTSSMHWDSLYVYFDGALSLYFLGSFDTILDVRNLPGTSLLTYLFFKITGPTDINAYYLQGILFSLMVLSVSLVSYRLYGINAGVLSFILIVSNPYLWDVRQLFGSDIPFTSLLSALVFLLFFFNNRAVVGILFCLLILIRPSGVLLFLAVLLNAYWFKKEKAFDFRPFVIGIIGAFGIHYALTGNFASPILTYFDEVGVLTGFDLSYVLTNFIAATKNSAILINYVLAILILYRLSLTLAGGKMNIYEGVLLTFSALHIMAISLWPVPAWRYAIPIIPMLTIYVSGVTSSGRASRLMVVLVA
ncbi:MAG: hypothetical protein V3R93_08175, partial [Candidatus Hydrothermarchaeaceae archaeon]